MACIVQAESVTFLSRLSVAQILSFFLAEQSIFQSRFPLSAVFVSSIDAIPPDEKRLGRAIHDITTKNILGTYELHSIRSADHISSKY